jgi:choline dehydrogenase-like flavoprotein
MTAPAYYDCIIIGSGAGGAAAAYTLARAGFTVLVLEKGGALPFDGSTLDIDRVVRRGEFLSHEPWVDADGGTLVPEEHFNVGGKTAWYGAALARFSPREFTADVAHGCPAWPIDYADLAPYYDEAEARLGIQTFKPEPDLQRILARLSGASPGWTIEPLHMGLSRDITANPVEAAHFDGFASIAGLKHDASTAFLDPLRLLPNFRLETQAEVIALTMQAGSRRVSGVRLADGRHFYADRVLLAAGALHSPRILQRLIDQHDLKQGLPAAAAVGRRLKLHLLTALVAVSPGCKHDLLRKTVLLGHADFPHSSAQPLGFDGELIANLVPPVVPRALAKAIGARAYGFFLQTEDGSAPDNRVWEIAGAEGTQRVLDYQDRRTAAAAREHRAFVRAFRWALLRAGLANFGQRIRVTGTAHACGTLPAGGDPSTSVVDADGRVHGLEGLYVVDGSVLPRLSRVNPSLTIFAWSLRVAGRMAAAQSSPAPSLNVPPGAA